MRKPAARHPKLLVEAHGIHDQRVAFPAPHGGSVVAGDRFGCGSNGASIRMDDPPVPISAPMEDKNPAQLRLFDKLKAVGHLELTRTSGRKTSCQRIALQQRALPELIDGPCPWLERRDLIDVGDVRENAILVHGGFGRHILNEHFRACRSPISLAASRGTESDAPIGPARSRGCCRCCRASRLRSEKPSAGRFERYGSCRGLPGFAASQDSLNGHNITDLQGIRRPSTLLQLQGIAEFHSPIGDASGGISDVDEEERSRIHPVQLCHQTFEGRLSTRVIRRRKRALSSNLSRKENGHQTARDQACLQTLHCSLVTLKLPEAPPWRHVPTILRRGEPISSILPSASMRTGLPAASLASASMRTTQVV